MLEKKIIVFGAGHFSTRGQLEDETWSWGIDINGDETYLEFGTTHKERDENSQRFYHSIKNLLPKGYDFSSKITPPVSIPGSVGYSLNIPLEDFTNKDKIIKFLLEQNPSLPLK